MARTVDLGRRHRRRAASADPAHPGALYAVPKVTDRERPLQGLLIAPLEGAERRGLVEGLAAIAGSVGESNRHRRGCSAHSSHPPGPKQAPGLYPSGRYERDACSWATCPRVRMEKARQALRSSARGHLRRTHPNLHSARHRSDTLAAALIEGLQRPAEFLAHFGVASVSGTSSS